MIARPHGVTWLSLVLVICMCAVQSGCVRRRLTIRSNPPGARVYVDNYEIGRTPCATGMLYYGTRQIRLVKDGYETLAVNQPIPPPWYQIPPIDFVTENLVPGEIRDERTLSYDLVPQVIMPTEQLLSRAEALRRGAHGQGPVTPVPPLGTTQPLPSVPPGPYPPGVVPSGPGP
jgi:hypothetical protein